MSMALGEQLFQPPTPMEVVMTNARIGIAQPEWQETTPDTPQLSSARIDLRTGALEIDGSWNGHSFSAVVQPGSSQPVAEMQLDHTTYNLSDPDFSAGNLNDVVALSAAIATQGFSRDSSYRAGAIRTLTTRSGTMRQIVNMGNITLDEQTQVAHSLYPTAREVRNGQGVDPFAIVADSIIDATDPQRSAYNQLALQNDESLAVPEHLTTTQAILVAHARGAGAQAAAAVTSPRDIYALARGARHLPPTAAGAYIAHGISHFDITTAHALGTFLMTDRKTSAFDSQFAEAVEGDVRSLVNLLTRGPDRGVREFHVAPLQISVEAQANMAMASAHSLLSLDATGSFVLVNHAGSKLRREDGTLDVGTVLVAPYCGFLIEELKAAFPGINFVNASTVGTDTSAT